VNGKAFPNSMKKLIKALESEGILTAPGAEKANELIKVCRHMLSHLEFAPLLFPDPQALRDAADLVNKMFASVPNPPLLRGWV